MYVEAAHLPPNCFVITSYLGMREGLMDGENVYFRHPNCHPLSTDMIAQADLFEEIQFDPR